MRFRASAYEPFVDRLAPVGWHLLAPGVCSSGEEHPEAEPADLDPYLDGVLPGRSQIDEAGRHVTEFTFR